MNDPQLMRLLDFSESDLQANRNRRITERQTVRLQKMEAIAKRRTAFGFFGNIFMALTGLGGAALYVTAMTKEGSGLDFGTICFASIFGILWPLLWGAAGYSGLRRIFAKVGATLKKAAGPITVEKTVKSHYNSDSHTTTHENIYELRVDGHTFIVNPVLSNYMKRGDVYAVYFADFNHKEKSKEILSIELLKSTGGAPSPEVIFHDDVEVVERIKQGDVMGAIRAHRSIHGSGFEESRAVVDDIQSRLGISSRNNR